MFCCIYSNYLHIRRIRSTSDLEKYESKIKELRVWRNHQSSLWTVYVVLLYLIFFMDHRILIQYLNLNIYLKLRNWEKTVSSQHYRKRRKKSNEISHGHMLPFMCCRVPYISFLQYIVHIIPLGIHNTLTVYVNTFPELVIFELCWY